MEIAEIQKADHVIAMDQDVMVICVPVDHSMSNRLKSWGNFGFEAGQNTLNQASIFVDVMEIIANPCRTLQVPFQIAIRGGVGETGEPRIDGTEQTA